MLLMLAGVVILFAGWNLFRAVFFPWAFLLMMIPIPDLVLNQITFPLQLLASQVAATVLPVFGVPVLREGNVINLAAMPLEVAEACSGIRSLMSLFALAIIYGYLLEKRLWVRWVLAHSLPSPSRYSPMTSASSAPDCSSSIGVPGGRRLFPFFLGTDYISHFALHVLCAASTHPLPIP